MGGMMAAGCLLIAYSPVASIILGYTARRSALLVLTIASAFAWLMAILLSSLVWLAIPPLKETHGLTAAVSAVFQEAVRWLVVYAYVRAEDQVVAMSRKAAARGPRPAASTGRGVSPLLFNDLSASVACGAGYAAMHTTMAYGALLGTATTTDAAFYRAPCTAVSVNVLSAGASLLYTVLHVALQVVATDAWRALTAPRAHRASALSPAPSTGRRTAWAMAAAPTLLHVAFALATLLNQTSACGATLPLLTGVTLVSLALALWRVRQPGYTARAQVVQGSAAAAAASVAAVTIATSGIGGAGAHHEPEAAARQGGGPAAGEPSGGRGKEGQAHAEVTGVVRNPYGATVARRGAAAAPAPASASSPHR